MTDLQKPVRRRTIQVSPAIRRRLVVQFAPGDLLMIREERRRRWFAAPLAAVYTMLVRRTVETERVEAKRKREARRCAR